MTRFRAPLVAWPQTELDALISSEMEGHAPLHVLVAEHDFAVDGGAIGAIGLDAFLPDNAIVVGGFVEVLTTYTSAGADAGTIALSANAANDLVSAIAISDASNPWDAGMHAIIPDFATVGDFKKMTAKREVTATVAAQALTAGKMRVYLFYLPSI